MVHSTPDFNMDVLFKKSVSTSNVCNAYQSWHNIILTWNLYYPFAHDATIPTWYILLIFMTFVCNKFNNSSMLQDFSCITVYYLPQSWRNLRDNNVMLFCFHTSIPMGCYVWLSAFTICFQQLMLLVIRKSEGVNRYQARQMCEDHTGSKPVSRLKTSACI